MIEKVYIETTIPSYLVSEQSENIIILSRQIITKDWWNIERKKYELFVSPIVIEEIANGDKHYAVKRQNEIKNLKVLREDENIDIIAEFYMKQFNFPEKIVRDIYHVSYSVYYEMDYLLSWNCSHLANAHFKKQLLKLNNQKGYKTPEICTPEELK